MKLLNSLKWPLTIVVVVALALLGVILIGGNALGIPEATQTAALSWVAGIGALLAAPLTLLVVYLTRDEDHNGTPDFLERDKLRNGGGGALALVIVAAALASASGCGASALGVQADALLLGATLWAEADIVMTRTRAAELDQVLADARVACANGCTPERAQYHLDRHDSLAASWAVAMECRNPVAPALRGWADGLDFAKEAASEELGVRHAIAGGARFALIYQGFVQCVNTARPDAELPPLPPGIEQGARGVTR